MTGHYSIILLIYYEEKMEEGKLSQLRQKILKKCSYKKRNKLKAMKREGEDTHYYDDDIAETISEEFTDRISVIHLIGDIIRAFGGLIGLRREIKTERLEEIVLKKIINDKKISRKDIADLTRISKVSGNTIIPFMNGGPEGPNWNNAPDGFYDQIDKAEKFIIGVELGFKGDSYGYEVAEKLIAKKQESNIHISVLIDGFVSIFMQKPDRDNPFQKSTQDMIKKMKNAGINVRINDSWNPASSDFLAANHVKLWIFDGATAFFGGIGIESQFKETLYDQMDLVRGPFVKVLTLMAILLLTNQKKSLTDSDDGATQIHEMKEKIKEVFLPNVEQTKDIFFELAMNVPGYVQDAQKKYIKLLKHKHVREIYIMAPYFSDDKIARALVKASTVLCEN